MSAKEGWGQPAQAEKPHYFRGDGNSLCGHWAYLGVLTIGRPRQGDCRACARALQRKPAPVVAATPEVRH